MADLRDLILKDFFKGEERLYTTISDSDLNIGTLSCKYKKHSGCTYEGECQYQEVITPGNQIIAVMCDVDGELSKNDKISRELFDNLKYDDPEVLELLKKLQKN